MPIQIDSIAYHLPEQVCTNEELREENPQWDMALVEAQSGVIQRHIASADETALDLAYLACQKLLESNGRARSDIDAIIFCTQSADHVMPPNACILHDKLDLPDNVFAFDLNLACSGFIYGLGIAQGLVDSGIAKNVILVNADTYSKFIHEKDRATRTLFGDAAAATWIRSADAGLDIFDIQCATSGRDHEKFIIPAGGSRIPKSDSTKQIETDRSGNHRTPEHIHMDGMGVLSFMKTKVPEQILKILSRNSMTVDDVDLFVFHQASKLALNSLTRVLKIEPNKTFVNLANIGNTVSASIPIALKDGIDSGAIQSGDTLLLSGFGVGLSWGTALLRY